MLETNEDFEKRSFLFTYVSTSIFSILLGRFDKNTLRNANKDQMRIAAIIAPFYFVANWTYNSGLELTTVSSSSTIQSTSSFFALLISVLLRLEHLTWRKCAACGITILGTAIVAQFDGKHGNFVGDVLSLLSSILFAVYTTILETMLYGTESVTMIFGFVGLFIFAFGWLLIPLLHVSGVEAFVLPSLKSVMIVVCNALIGFVVADLLWARSIMLTSSFVGNTATSLTVPFSLLYDWCFKAFRFNFAYAIGAVFCVVGSLLVSFVTAREHDAKSKASKSNDTIISV